MIVRGVEGGFYKPINDCWRYFCYNQSINHTMITKSLDGFYFALLYSTGCRSYAKWRGTKKLCHVVNQYQGALC